MLCQKCRQPLRLDGSLDDLNPAAYDLLVSTTKSAAAHKPTSPSCRPPAQHPQEQARKSLYEKVTQNTGPPSFKRTPAGGTRDAAMSFIYLTESQVGHPQSTRALPSPSAKPNSKASDEAAFDVSAMIKADEMSRISRLFEILSARSDIDHTICVDCAEMLVGAFQRKLDSASKERDALVGHLKQAQADIPSADEIKAQQDALKKAEQDKAAALKELKVLEQEKDDLDEQILLLEKESRELDIEEDKFWKERNAFASRMTEFQSERDSINVKYSNDSQLLDKLQRSNVFNDTFCISHDGSFATINGLRLGRLSTKPVDWPEINAAWGHALLLLVVVAEKLGYRFQGYEAQPIGSTSKIVRYEQASPSSSRLGNRGTTMLPPPKKHVLDLYSSGDMPLGLTFMHRKFDNAMVAFLELVRQLGAFVHDQTRGTDTPLSLPYKIEGDRIGDVSIKLGIAQDDGWTKACKLTLTCCKFLLAHASHVSSDARNANVA